MWRTITAAAVLITLTGACTSDDPEAAAQAVGSTVTNADVTADDVTDAIEAAGLELVNPRDNSHNCEDNGGSLPCLEQLTTDLFTVTVWKTEADAVHAVQVAAGDPPIRVGTTTTVAFHEGGSTPPYDRAAYETALTALDD